MKAAEARLPHARINPKNYGAAFSLLRIDLFPRLWYIELKYNQPQRRLTNMERGISI